MAINDVQNLLIFAQVVESGSFTRAAQRLAIANSSVSKRVQQLEQDLGVQLINRSTRRLHITEEGQQLYQHCARIKQQIEEASQLLGRSRDNPSGVVRVSVPPLMAYSRLAPRLPEFLRRYPDLNLELQVTERPSDLSAGGFDLSIRTRQLSDSSMVARRLCTLTALLCAAPRYLDARGRPAQPRDLAQHNYLSWQAPEQKPFTELIFSRGQRSYKTPISGNFTSTDAMAVKEAAVHGAGITLMPDFAVQAELDSGLLEVLLPDYRMAEYPLSLVYPRRDNIPAKVRVTADFIAEVFSG